MSNANLCDTVYIWLSNDTCAGTPGTDDLQLEEIQRTPTTTTGSESFRVSEMLARNNSSCGATDVERTFRLCATTRLFDSTITTNCRTVAETIGTPAVTVTYDAKPPAAPEAPSVSGLDGALNVRVTAQGDAEFIRVEVRALGTDADGGTAPVGEPITTKEQSTDNTSFRMEGLQNDVEYAVQARAVDLAGNESGLSEAVRGTPIASSGFFDAYVDAGGSEKGGCAAAGGSLAGSVALAVLGLWLSRRKQS
ncbi:hypothetical protein HPC49_28160 [Pyxidicoccus fallax]|uniref:Fibronectin type-III domain-containing protein n=1 Tax=Pyxidicoccus fallax TaxID=394095 RepID=A0A848LU00_9BACT|nr:hypothetical protein [Pyxidicoccus fallax]NPC82079.1 hypothetical protein [Pyxidicoccus fallax]